MEEIKTLVDYIQAIGFTGLLILLALPKTRKFLGFGNGEDTPQEHEKLWNAIKEIKDNHLHEIKTCLSNVKQDVAWIRGKLDSQ